MEESDWELNSVVAMATGEGTTVLKGSTQNEKEIRFNMSSRVQLWHSIEFFSFARYFADVMLSACCVEWGVVLAVLLLDTSLVNQMLQSVSDAAVLSRVTQGYEELCDWADNEWCVCVCVRACLRLVYNTTLYSVKMLTLRWNRTFF